MAYFAEINDKNIVQRVVVVDSAEYANKLFGGIWIETTIDKTKNYAGVGYTYILELDNFMPPQPNNDNYVLDSETLRWKPKEETYTYLFFGKKPDILITENNKIYKFDGIKWDEI